MFIPVQVEPEVGEIAAGYSRPYLASDGSPQVDFVRGIIEKVNIERKELKVSDANHWIPFHRVMTFTFGGVELENTEYDDRKRYEEDQKEVDRLIRRARAGR